MHHRVGNSAPNGSFFPDGKKTGSLQSGSGGRTAPGGSAGTPRVVRRRFALAEIVTARRNRPLAAQSVP